MIKQDQKQRFKRGLSLCQQIQAMIKAQDDPKAVQDRMKDAYKIMLDVQEGTPAATPIAALLAVDLGRYDEAQGLISKALALPFEDYVKKALENARLRIIEIQSIGGNA
jgi:hypothetical protein